MFKKTFYKNIHMNKLFKDIHINTSCIRIYI